MLSDAFFGALALVYYVCFLSLIGLTLFIAFGMRQSKARAGLRITFVLLSLSLLSWQATMFIEVRTALPIEQLWVGRFNFAIVAMVVYLALLFVRRIPTQKSDGMTECSPLLLVETASLFLITLFTPLVDAVEQVVPGGRALTYFGPLYPFYLLHILSYLVLAIEHVFRTRKKAQDSRVRRQLGLVGFGLIATGGVAFITNGAMPYWLGDYRYCDVGTISVQIFILSVAYATFMHGLFDVRVIIRETLVYGFLMAFVLSAYSSTVFLITEYLTDGQDKVKQFAVLIIAFSFDPIRRILESKTDRLLFGERTDTKIGKTKQKRRR